MTPLDDISQEFERLTGFSPEAVPGADRRKRMAEFRHFYDRALRLSLVFYASEILRGPPETGGRFLVGQHHTAWSEIASAHRRAVILAARIHGKSQCWAWAYPLWMADRVAPARLGYIVSGAENLATNMLAKIRAEVCGGGENGPANPKLAHLLPFQRDKANVIRFSNGSEIRAKGFGGRVRGGHPFWMVCDDVLTDDHIYSDLLRKKGIDFFLSALAPMVVVGGQMIVVGCVGLETWVPTASGLSRIGDLSPGPLRPQTLYDYGGAVHGRDGIRTATMFWSNGEAATKLVRLDRGFRLEGTHRHPVLVMPHDGIPVWKRLDELAVGDFVGVKIGTESWGGPIDLRPFKASTASSRGNHLELPDEMTEDLAYLLGLWTADGSYERSGRVMIINLEPEIREWLESGPFGMRFAVHEKAPHILRCSSLIFLRLIQWLGGRLEKAPGKIVPTRIMGADRTIAAAFLRGYFDGDGSAYRNGRVLQVSSTSTSHELSHQVHILLANLGILSTFSIGRVPPPTAIAVGRHRPATVRMVQGDAARFLREVGFRVHRKQDVVAGDLRPSRSLPYPGALLRQMRQAKPRRPKGLLPKQPVNISQIQGVRTALLDSVRAAFDWFVRCGVPSSSPAALQLAANLAEAEAGMVWLPVKRIDDGRAFTADFVIPEGHSFISNGVVSHNTPLHQEDLYAYLERTGAYHVSRFPVIFNGAPLWPAMYDQAELDLRHQELGSEIRWSREFLCRPISDESSLFPAHLFDGPDVMQPYELGLPAGYWQNLGYDRYIGVDLAMSSSASADWFVIFVLAYDPATRNRWIVDIIRRKGLDYQEQVRTIVDACDRYEPAFAFIEANQYQRVITDMVVRATDAPIKAFYTSGRATKQASTERRGMRAGGSYIATKHALDQGVPSLRMLLEQGKLKIPWGEGTRDIVRVWIGEMQSFGWVNGKLQGVGAHDDTPMALWMADRAIHTGLARSAPIFLGPGGSPVTDQALIEPEDEEYGDEDEPDFFGGGPHILGSGGPILG